MHDDNACMEAFVAVDAEMRVRVHTYCRSLKQVKSAPCKCCACRNLSCLEQNSRLLLRVCPKDIHFYPVSHCHACCCQELLCSICYTVCLDCKSCSPTLLITHKGCNKGDPPDYYGHMCCCLSRLLPVAHAWAARKPWTYCIRFHCPIQQIELG